MPLGATRLLSLANPGTVAGDTGREPVTVTAYGDAQVDTAISKFGGASGLFDGTGDALLLDTPILPATDDWTVEMWVYPTSIGAVDYFFSQYSAGSSGRTTMYMNGSGQVGLFINGGPSFTSTGTLSSSTWQHIAWVRNGSSFKIYIDGTEDGSGTGSPSIQQSQNSVVGAQDSSGSNGFIGNIDEVRVSSTARYTAGFTVPSGEFANDTDTLMLLHCNGTDGSTTFEDDTFNALGTGGNNVFQYNAGATEYRIHEFTSNGTFTAIADGNLDVLLVGGGGGGESKHNSYYNSGGAGGGGEVLYQSSVSVTNGTGYSITIGDGGRGGKVTFRTSTGPSQNGDDTTAFGYTAGGGGHGGHVYNNYAPSSSGGGGGGGYGRQSVTGQSGASSTGTAYAGGDGYGGSTDGHGGGGGGAGGNGANATSSGGGNGGIGYDASPYFGTSVGDNGYFGGGGGGGVDRSGNTVGSGGQGGGGDGASSNSKAPSGTDGTGGGGGSTGGATSSGTAYEGGNGGKGIVLIRYTAQ
jgi:hypothetical protein